MQLRPYQQQVKDEINAAWQRSRGVLAVMPTGAGKTTTFANILADEPAFSVAIAHRSELVTQMSLTLARYGVRHRVIGSDATQREAARLHMSELQRNFVEPGARCAVASVDTLVRCDPAAAWVAQTKLVVIDEAHHVRTGNKWASSSAMFRNARVLGVTATPFRADGAGLGSHADGIFDEMVVGPSMRELIDIGNLCEYRIFAPPNAVNLADVALSASGDYSPAPLRDAVHKAHITGDIVSHYLKLARNKLAIVFTVDIETSVEAAESFRAAGVAAEVISGKTPAALRNAIMRKFRNREIHVLCNCDVLGEGTDVPAVECVIMARPTMSKGLYIQQFGRALRPMDGKPRALIIDAVGNVIRHGLPDAPMTYTLDRRERRSKGAAVDAIPLRTCLNPDVDGTGIPCAQPYERLYRCCPYCGHYPEPALRSGPDQVDGDLHELDADVLAAMRGAIARVNGASLLPSNLPPEAIGAIKRKHWERQQAVAQLVDTMQIWGGVQTDRNGRELHEAQRAFYLTFGTDVATAQTLGRADAEALSVRIRNDLIKQGVTA